VEAGEQACDHLDADLRSGYVRVLLEMTEARWSDTEVAAAIRAFLQGWFYLLSDVAERAGQRIGSFGPFSTTDIAALVGERSWAPRPCCLA
jgi:hypothetical protein